MFLHASSFCVFGVFSDPIVQKKFFIKASSNGWRQLVRSCFVITVHRDCLMSRSTYPPPGINQSYLHLAYSHSCILLPGNILVYLLFYTNTNPTPNNSRTLHQLPAPQFLLTLRSPFSITPHVDSLDLTRGSPCSCLLVRTTCALMNKIFPIQIVECRLSTSSLLDLG